MISAPDFNKKQIVFLFCNNGEKIAFRNENIIVKQKDGSIKFQCSCYRIFIIYVVGHCSITTVLIQKAKKYGFHIALLTSSFKLYSSIGAPKDGNTMLKKKQYSYNGNAIATLIVKNKIYTQLKTLEEVRNKSEAVKEAIEGIRKCYMSCEEDDDVNSLMAYEGTASKLYFKNHFNNILWSGRKPRIKADSVNCVLDIGYTLLFAFIEALLEAYGFDTYCGVLHKQFYMRKSLVCDLVEPFRFLIDKAVKKAYNLKQIQEDDFDVINRQYRLKWEKTADYTAFLMRPIIDNKDGIFLYIQAYYRSFMKEQSIEEYPFFCGGVVKYDSYKL